MIQDRLPLVSIIMPAYNSEKHIRESIESVLSQSMEDWELLVIDDASQDETADIVQGYVHLDKRIRLFKNDRNIGTATSRNIGLDNSKAKWVAFLDSDDIWYSNKLERQLEIAEKEGAELVCSSYCILYENTGKRVNYRIPSKISYEKLLRENIIGCSTVLIRSQLFKNRRFLAESYHEDYVMWLSLLKSGCNAIGCDEVLVEWRSSEIGRSFDKRRAALNRWKIYRSIEHLSLPKACFVFCVYGVRGIKKHKSSFLNKRAPGENDL